ncbi:MAG: tetratricopeptide repeat protein [Solirubrobacterales bacterium]
MAAALADGAFEPIAYSAASIVIWAAVIAGLAGRGLPTAPVSTTGAVAGASLAGIVILAIASVAWASDQGRAFEEAVRASAYLGLFALAACTASRAGRDQWIAGLTAGLGAVSILALLSYLQPGLLDSGELERLIPSDAGRLSYPIGYWNGAAALLAMDAILLAYAGASAPYRSLRSLAIAAMPLALLGVWLTSSRGGAAAAVAGMVVLLAASRDRGRQLVAIAIGAAGAVVLIGAAEQMEALTTGLDDAARRSHGDRMSALCVGVLLLTGGLAWALDGARLRLRLPRPAVIGLISAVALAAVAAVVIADPAERFREFKSPPEELEAPGANPVDAEAGSSGRWQFWTEAVDAFESAPVAGIGAGAYEDWWAQNATLPVFVRNPHSLPLQQTAELGAVGLVLLLAFVGVLGVAAARRLIAGAEGDTAALLALLVAAGISAAIDWTWAIPAVFGPALVAAGLLTASSPGRALGRRAYWLGLGTIAFAWAAVIAAGLVVLTEVKLDQSREAAAERRLDEGIDRALEARTVQPWSPEPYTQLALLEEERGDYERAIERLRQAEARDPEDWRLAVIEARLQRARGDQNAARQALERARSLNPLSPVLAGLD